jgi:branched-chain amino acid transport system substrate-binding protein
LRVSWLAAIGCLLGISALAAAGCGSSDDGGGGGGGTPSKNVTVYSSLPLQGASRPQSLDVIKGEKLALKERNNKGGSCTVSYTSLDDSTAQAGTWDAGQTSANARRVAQDKNSIALLGEFNSGASAISIPITNEAQILQISPSNTALELTKNPGPSGKGAPDKYYPKGKGSRNYARVVAADHIQGSAQADWMKEKGVKKVYILNDRQVYGAGVAKTTGDAAKRRGIQVVGTDGIDPKAPNYRSLASKIKSTGADAMFFGGIVDNNAVQLYKDVGAALPNATLWGPDGVATTTFTKPLPASVAKRVFITVATINPKDYGPKGQKFYKDFKAAYGNKAPEPYAIYGFEAMDLTLDAMSRAGDKCNDRKKVIDEVFSTKNKQGVTGTYDIDPDGDVTLHQFGRHIIVKGDLSPVKTVQVKEDSNGKPLL